MRLSRTELERIVARVAESLGAEAPPEPLAPGGPAAPAAGAHPEVMTVEQLADYLQLHPQVLYRHIRQGHIPVSRIGKTLRFKRSVIDRWLEGSAWRSVGAEPPGPPERSDPPADEDVARGPGRKFYVVESFADIAGLVHEAEGAEESEELGDRDEA